MIAQVEIVDPLLGPRLKPLRKRLRVVVVDLVDVDLVRVAFVAHDGIVSPGSATADANPTTCAPRLASRGVR